MIVAAMFNSDHQLIMILNLKEEAPYLVILVIDQHNFFHIELLGTLRIRLQPATCRNNFYHQSDEMSSYCSRVD